MPNAPAFRDRATPHKTRQADSSRADRLAALRRRRLVRAPLSADENEHALAIADVIKRLQALGCSMGETLARLDETWPDLRFRVVLGGLFLAEARRERAGGWPQ